jgi:serine/threonine-protein kinase
MKDFLKTKTGIITAFLLSGIFLIGIMDFLVMPLYVKHGREFEMPDLVGKNTDEARQAVRDFGFDIVVTDSVYTPDYPPGIIAEQLPAPFATVKKGRRVYVRLSIGEQPATVPNIQGISPREAELTLRAYNLEPGYTTYEYSDYYLDGTVCRQSLPPGQPVRQNSRVNIAVSLGEMPGQRKIPNLIGKSLDAATQQLKLLGLSVGSVIYEAGSNILPMTILNQSPGAGSALDEHTTVDLVVSKIGSDSSAAGY